MGKNQDSRGRNKPVTLNELNCCGLFLPYDKHLTNWVKLVCGRILTKIVSTDINVFGLYTQQEVTILPYRPTYNVASLIRCLSGLEVNF